MEQLSDMMQSTLTSTLVLGWYVLCVAAMWKIFTKAGVAGWVSLIPFYNMYTLYKISLGSGWWFLLLLVPVIGIAAMVYMNFRLAQAFGKSYLFGLGLIFISPVFMMILGFGSSRYQGVGWR